MCAVNAHCCAVPQATNVVPDDLLVTETGPTMLPALLQELLEGSTFRRDEKWLACDTVVVGHLSADCLNFLHPGAQVVKGVAAWFGQTVQVVAADAIFSFSLSLW